MADIDGLTDPGAADGEKDLVADFLMREQDKLAGLEDDFGTLNLFSVNIHVHQKPSSAIFREGIRLGLVYRVRVSFR